MGNVFAETSLKNGSNVVRLKYGQIQENNVRSVTVNSIVGPLTEQLTGARGGRIISRVM